MTGDKRQWARDQARRGIPRWSPDGTRLAYQWARPEGRGEEGTVAERPTEAGEEQLLSGPLKVLVLPFGWSPDGQSVLVSSTTSTGKTAIAWMLDGMDK